MSSNLYIAGFPASWSMDDLRQVFGSFGAIETLKILSDQHTKQSRGVGFIKYVSHMDAVNAIHACHGRAVDGETMPLTVKFAQPKIYPPSDTNPGSPMGSLTPQTPRRALKSVSPMSNGDSTGPYYHSQPTDSPPSATSNTNTQHVYVACFPDSWTKDDLHRLCSRYGKCSAKILVDINTSKSRGCGFVRFNRIEDAISAINGLNDAVIDGCPRSLQVRFASRKQSHGQNQSSGLSPKHHALTSQSSPQSQHAILSYDLAISPTLPYLYPPASPSAYDYNTAMAMLSPSSFYSPYTDPYAHVAYSAAYASLLSPMSQSAGTVTPLHTGGSPHSHPDHLTLFVCHLPPAYNEAQLATLFRSYGSVTQARIVRDRDGESKGYAFVSYGSIEECMHAIAALNGLAIEGTGKNLKVAWRRPTQSQPQSHSHSAMSSPSPHYHTLNHLQPQTPSPQPSESGSERYAPSSPQSPPTIFNEPVVA